MNRTSGTMNQESARMMRGGCMANPMNGRGYGMNRNMDGRQRYDGNREVHERRDCDREREMHERHSCDGNREMHERHSCDGNREMHERHTCDGNREMRERRGCDGNREMHEKHSYDRNCEPDRSRSIAIPTGSRKQLLCFINEVSFAVYETLLYLDTHPDDQEAMEFFREHNYLRNQALKEYARLYGPLTISTANDHESQCWEWMNQPWPWEGGDC